MLDTEVGHVAEPRLEPTRIVSGFVELPDGLRLHCLDSGGDGPACLLLHGFGHHAGVWNEVFDALRPSHRVVAIDQRGHGDSSWDPAGRYGISQLAEDVEVALAQLGLRSVALVGHSLGGRVAIRVAASCRRGRARIAGLALLDVGPEVWRVGVERIAQDEREGWRRFASRAEHAEWLARRHPLARPHALARLAGGALRPAEGGSGYVPKTDPRFLDGMGREAPREQRWAELRGVRCETLVLRGIASSVLPREVAERIVHALPRATLATVPRAGHGVLLDHPDFVARQLRRFLVALADRASRPSPMSATPPRGGG